MVSVSVTFKSHVGLNALPKILKNPGDYFYMRRKPNGFCFGDSLVRTEFSKRVARNCLFNGSDYYKRFCLNRANNREIRQSRLSASGHGFEP